jgi:hypothetical protein
VFLKIEIRGFEPPPFLVQIKILVKKLLEELHANALVPFYASITPNFNL